jgi:hypothetical protein
MAKKKKQKTTPAPIIIPRKALYGIAPAVGIMAVLLAKGRAPEVLLFCIGIILGIIIMKGWRKLEN